MSKAVVFTNKMSLNLMNWLQEHSEKTKKSKREILETALNKYRHETIQKDLTEDFKRAKKDKEMMALADEGLNEYEEQLTKLGL